MKQFESKYIIQVSHPEYPYFGDNKFAYIKKMGNHASYLTFTNDIYDAKLYNTREAANKAANRAEMYVETAYNNGWMTFGYDLVSDGNGCHYFSKVMKFINTKVIEVKLIIP